MPSSDDDLVPLEAVPPANPSGYDPGARAAFLRMIHECGPTVFRMPTSCEMFLRQHLGGYDAERAALAEALRKGVPEKIAGEAGSPGFPQVVDGLKSKLTGSGGLTAAQAAWAVDAWKDALVRPVNAAPPPVVRESRAAAPALSDQGLRRAMMGIAVAGGGLGGFLGCGAVHLFYMWLFVSSNTHKAGQTEAMLGLGLFHLVFMLGGGICGALGSWLGWHLGRGNDKPWASFSAGFGSAFGTGTVATFVGCCMLFSPIFVLFASFGAVYTTAARGGHNG